MQQKYLVPKKFVKSLVDIGFSFFTSVPCSVIAPILNELDDLSSTKIIKHISSLREDIAIGIASGAVFSGEKAVVLMQNSGFGLSINSIASLVLPYRIPMLFIISLRGYTDKDTEENRTMGRITSTILDQMYINSKILNLHSENADIQEIVKWASDCINKDECAAILIPPNHN